MATLLIEMQQALKIQERYSRKVCDEMTTLPEGSLYCSIQGPHKYYYHSTFRDGKRQKEYLSIKQGKQAQLISDLKRKRFLLGCKKILEGNVVALRACLLKYEEFDPAQISSRLAATYDNIKALERTKQVSQVKQDQQGSQGKHDLQDEQDQQNLQSQNNQQERHASDWQLAQYPHVEMYEESLKHEAIGGLMVRSKSEALIAFALDLAHVPFHYEEILELDNKKIAPDFTILHPVTGERIYWEHFGMMDDAAYATETFKKMILYGQNGILPGKNFIYTMETNSEPLSIREIQGMITHYLLA
jgi:hypothetical protein